MLETFSEGGNHIFKENAREHEWILVTNNPLLQKHEGEVLFLEGSFEDVLLKARDMVHLGHRLISHPLGASMRMLFSPYRSILLGAQEEKVGPEHFSIIESSIESYRNSTSHRKADLEHNEDYAVIDRELLLDAIKEHEKMNPN